MSYNTPVPQRRTTRKRLRRPSRFTRRVSVAILLAFLPLMASEFLNVQSLPQRQFVRLVGVVSLISVTCVALVCEARFLARNRRRRRQNQCLKCGYDLRHSPTRCPECGSINAYPLHPSPVRYATQTSNLTLNLRDPPPAVPPHNQSPGAE